ncbi:MAG: 30S ribosomal protein S1 [Syntrophobacteraceae bacterium]
MEEEKSFAELLRESEVKPVRFSPGQKVKARIVNISSEWVFIDLGAKSEGYLEAKEFLNEEGELSVREGEVIEAYYLSAEEGQMRFTTRISGGDAARYHLEEAWHNKIPVEGLVEKEIKGGFEIRIAGGLRGFCPFSQMGLQRENPKEVTGRHLNFLITQYGEKGRNIVLSNRAVMEEERRRQKEEQKGRILEGSRVTGTISSIRDFGAFVTIGGIEGLIPVSEIGWERTEQIGSVLQVGQEVEVVAMKLDWENDRFSFSLKRALPDPWEGVEKAFPVGSQHSGTVVRLTNFGAFVSLAPGVDGLLHISKLSSGGKKIRHPQDAVAKGEVRAVKIEAIDRENKRISLSLAGGEGDEEQGGEDFSNYSKGRAPMGTLADLLQAKLEEKRKK